MINNLTMFYKIVAIIETVLLVIASIVGVFFASIKCT